MERENEQKKEIINQVREEMESWKSKARELQNQLDELKTQFRDLEQEHKDMGTKQEQCKADSSNCKAEIQRLQSKIHDLEAEESDLKRRLNAAVRYKDVLRDAKDKQANLEFSLEKLMDKLEFHQDNLASCKIDLLGAHKMAVSFCRGRPSLAGLIITLEICNNLLITQPFAFCSKG